MKPRGCSATSSLWPNDRLGKYLVFGRPSQPFFYAPPGTSGLPFLECRLHAQLLPRAESAVDDELGPGDERRFIAREIKRCGGDLLRPAHSTDRLRAGHFTPMPSCAWSRAMLLVRPATANFVVQ